MIGTLAFLLIIGSVYFYCESRRSVGFLWVCLLLPGYYFLDAINPGNSLINMLVCAASLVAALHISDYFYEDPFSYPRVVGTLRKVVDAIGGVIRRVGFGPRSQVVDATQSAEVKKLVTLASHNQLSSVQKRLEDTPVEERFELIQSLCTTGKQRDAILKAYKRDRASAIAGLLAGNCFVNMAWEARGSGTADTITQAGYMEFITCLHDAEIAFNVAIDRGYAGPEPYIGLITQEMGAGGDPELLKGYYQKANNQYPHHYDVHQNMMCALAEKWGGEPGAALAFARQTCVGDAAPALLRGVLAGAHIECWLYQSMQDEQAADYYFRDSAVMAELSGAFAELRQSDDHNTHYYQALNNFAFCFSKAEQVALLRTCLSLLKGRYYEHPWHYSDDSPLAMFDVGYAIDAAVKKAA